ncbi:protein kintoun [Anopheles ziemanni]|uniref:protein kintoun n=1 Tax=Anopheles coustani TaxID=139045 RepID=UPI002658B105|nr:protein kintoun [Anopheles coustani]XP_058125657.1 protein kintoun [Anopheles coustani]XP_058168683.1 protein kintoun [Anopheles ziemanni]
MSTKDFNLSRDEFRNITRCLENEEFRDLFADYCKDLRDNRQQYEEELAILEAERGYDVKFLNPKPGYVIKTVVDGKRKGFINVCQCELVQKPSIVPGKYEHESKAVQWNIPYAQSQPRRDYDNKRIECIVYDVMFHPDSLGLAARNDHFRKLLNDTSLDAVEGAFKVKLDRANLRFPKLQYKGTPSCTVMRNKKPNFDSLPKDELFDKLLPPMPTPAAPTNNNINGSETKKSKPNDGPKRGTVTEAQNKENIQRSSARGYTTPEYKIVQRRDVEYEEMTHELDAKIDVTIPRELKITITLPLLKSAAECTLDVTKATLYLVSEKPAKYKLELKLPYEVRENEGTAQFNVDARTLTVTLPVLRKRPITLQDINRANAPEIANVGSTQVNQPTSGKLIEEIEETSGGAPTVANGSKSPANGITQPSVVEAPRKTIFPKFSVNKMENLFAFTLNVRNVDPGTIELDSRTDSVHCRFSNVGNGFFPCYYVFFVRFPNAQVTEVQHEEWDNNLIIQVTLNTASVASYHAGPNEHDTVEYSIMEDITDKINKFGKEIEDDSLCIAVVRQEKGAKARSGGLLSIEITKKDIDQQEEPLEDAGGKVSRAEPPSGTSVDECDDKEPETEAQARAMLTAKKNGRKKNKERSLSESFCDQLKVIVENEPATTGNPGEPSVGKNASAGMSPASKAIDAPDAKTRKFRSVSECVESSESMPSLVRKYKGILKRSSYDRSISECSSVDDLGTSVEMSLPGSMGEECRKTVRFNDAIRKQMFRSNTSILAMKKKSQKKKELKRRAAARRMSEGESTDNDEKELHHRDDDDDDEDDNCLSSDQHDEKDAMENDSGVSFDSESGDKEAAVMHQAASKSRKNNNNNKNSKNNSSNNSNNNTNNNKGPKSGNGLKSGGGQRRPSDSKNIEFKSDMIFDIEM